MHAVAIGGAILEWCNETAPSKAIPPSPHRSAGSSAARVAPAARLSAHVRRPNASASRPSSGPASHAAGQGKPKPSRAAASKPPGESVRSKGHAAPPARGGAPAASADDLAQLLRSHNAKFAAAKTYEPRTQSVAAMRAWEKRSGRAYASLSVEERIQANQEINAWTTSGGATPA